MNILLIGAGGREHALAWKIANSHQCDQLFIAPGNPGTALFGTNLPIKVGDFDALKAAALSNNIEMIIVGPEDPLVKGIYDFFANDAATQHINVIGPSAEAAQLEGSKAFSKQFMQRHRIPTAGYLNLQLKTMSKARSISQSILYQWCLKPMDWLLERVSLLRLRTKKPWIALKK